MADCTTFEVREPKPVGYDVAAHNTLRCGAHLAGSMNRNLGLVLDDIDWKILQELQANARTAFAELGRRVGLSTPAVAERVRRMEDAGVILGYHAQIDPAKVGLPMQAFIRVNVAGDKLTKFAALVQECPEVLECHRVTGSESFIIKVAVSDNTHLEHVIDSLMPYVATTTSMILSSPLTWSAVKPKSKEAIAAGIARGF